MTPAAAHVSVPLLLTQLVHSLHSLELPSTHACPMLPVQLAVTRVSPLQ